MKPWFLALGLLASLTDAATAAPGDPRTVQGTLEWPAALENSPFIVIRTDDGRAVYVNVTQARRTAPGQVGVGNRISAVGVESLQPHEIAAVRVGPGDSAIPGDTFPAPPAASIPPPPAASTATHATPPEPAQQLWRLHGTVQAVSGSTVTVRSTDGQTHTVDVSHLSQATRNALRRGEPITLFGVPQVGGKLVANGFIQTEPPPPAASPRTRP